MTKTEDSPRLRRWMVASLVLIDLMVIGVHVAEWFKPEPAMAATMVATWDFADTTDFQQAKRLLADHWEPIGVYSQTTGYYAVSHDYGKQDVYSVTHYTLKKRRAQ